MPVIALVKHNHPLHVREPEHASPVHGSPPSAARSGTIIGDLNALTSLLEWAKAEGLLVSVQESAGQEGYDGLVSAGSVAPGNEVVLFETGAGFDSTVEGKRRSLPTSLPVGGIITPV